MSPSRIGSRGTVWVQVSNNGIDFSGEYSVENHNEAVSQVDDRGKISFDYISVVRVLEIFPQMGPASGGTRVVISVDKLPHADDRDVGIYCRFTAEDRKSSVLKLAVQEKDETTILEAPAVICFTPAMTPQLLTLDLVLGEVDVTFSDSRFLVYSTPIMRDLRPASAHERGGSIVAIHGSGFKNTNAAFCRFGSHDLENGGTHTTVRATWLAESLLECVVPPARGLGTVSVDVTVNGNDYTTSGLRLSYTTQTVIISAWPLSGPAGGGALVFFSGTGFASQRNASEPPVCIFGKGSNAIHVPALSFTDTKASCRVPPSPVDLSASVDEHNNTQKIELRIFSADLLSSGEVSYHDLPSTTHGNLDNVNDVSGSIRSTSRKETWLVFTYIAETTVSALEPAFGPTEGGTVLRISGASIPTLPQLIVSCVFTGLRSLGPVFTRATVISNAIAECETPTVNNPGIATVRLAVSKNENVSLPSNTTTLVTTTSIQFTFHGEITVESVSPSLGPESGGTDVTLTLDRKPGLASFVPLVCVFGGLPEVPAQYLGLKSARCKSPPSAPGSVSLTLKTRRAKSASENSFGRELRFVYHDSVSLTSISPTEALASGGTRIRIQGTNFLNVSSLSCRFGGIAIVPAVFENPSVVICTVPALNINLLKDSFNASETSVTVSVAVSINGMHWSDVYIKGRRHQPRLMLLAGTSSIESLNPSHGPAFGGTDITVTLSSESMPLNPMHDALLRCRFSEVQTNINITEDSTVILATKTVPAFRVSSYLLRCKSPAIADQMSLSSIVAFSTVEVSFNGGTDFTSSGMTFGYYTTPLITSMMPHSGSEHGGLGLYISGANFPRNRGQSSMKCRFGYSSMYQNDSGLTVEAQWVSPSAVRCETPPHAPGKVLVALSFNGGVDYTSVVNRSVMTFDYRAAAKVVAFAPVLGSISGNTLIIFTGVNFGQFLTPDLSPTVYCRFVSPSTNMGYDVDQIVALAPAVVLSGTKMSCYSPPWPKPGPVNLQVTTESGENIYSEDNRLSFEYVAQLTVSHVSPTWGMLSGGTLVKVRATGLRNSSDLQCRFRSAKFDGFRNEKTGSLSSTEYTVSGIFLSSFRVACISPAVPYEGRYALELSNNGVDFSFNGLQFEYVEPPKVDLVIPSVGHSDGGTILQVTGSGFIDGGGALSCAFGSIDEIISVRAVFKSAFQVSCIAPKSIWGLGAVNVAVTTNGVDYSSASRTSGKGFKYVAFPTVSSVEPDDIASRGRIRPILIKGSSFQNSSSGGTQCYFKMRKSSDGERNKISDNYVITHAVYISSTLMHCTPPIFPNDLEFTSQLQISYNGQEFSNAVPINVSRLPEIISYSPMEVYAGESLWVNVTGNHFHNRPTLKCWSGGSFTFETKFLSPSLVSCKVKVPIPNSSNKMSAVMLFVSNNGHDFSSAPKSPTLIVRTAPLVYSIQPDLGPVSGGTRILISGRNLPPRGLNCQFGNHPPVSLELISVGGTTAFCRSPKFDAPGKTDFDLLFHGSPIMQKNEKLSYLAHPAITVSKVMPEAAVRTGGTTVILTGTGIQKSKFAHFSCEWGLSTVASASSEKSPGTFISHNKISCVSPSIQSAGFGFVGVSLNGEDFVRVGFEFLPVPRVSSVSPRTSPPEGGIGLILTGSNFVTPSSVGILKCCINGKPSTKGVAISGTRMRCDAPPSPTTAGGMPSTPVILSVTTDGINCNVNLQNDDRNGVQLTYRSNPVVTSIFPHFGTEIGGTIVSIFGSGFKSGHSGNLDDNSSQLHCHFGSNPMTPKNTATMQNHPIPAVVLSDTALTCRTPSMNAPAMALTQTSILVSTADSVVVSGSRVSFWYVPQVSVLEYFPSSGPSSGGTKITIRGSNFHDPLMNMTQHQNLKRNIKCKFTLSSSSVPVHMDRVKLTLATSVSSDGHILTCIAPFNPTGAYHLSLLTNDGSHDEVSVGAFIYEAGMKLLKIVPDMGPITGGTRVAVIGANFVDSGSLLCKFGESSSYAHFMNANRLECDVPVDASTGVHSYSAITNITEPQHSVRFRLDGVGMESRKFVSLPGLSFSFYEHPVLESVQPSTLIKEHSTTVVRIQGSGFVRRAMQKDWLRCAWLSDYSRNSDDQLVLSTRAAWLSPELVECEISSGEPGQTLQITVTMNGRDFSSSAAEMQVVPNLKVISISPNVGYTGSGFIDDAARSVSVSGTGFTNSSGLKCKFDSELISPWAAFVSRTKVLCGLPHSVTSPIIAHVTVSIDNGTTFTGRSPETAFSFYMAPVISKITPATSLLNGGAMITLFSNHRNQRGGPFVDTAGLVCVIGGSQGLPDVTVAARFINSSAVECKTPPSAKARLAEIYVWIVNGDRYGISRDVPFVSELPVFSEMLRLQPLPHLRFLRPPLLASIAPKILFPGAVVTITGSNFEDNPHLAVRVGDVLVPSSALNLRSASTLTFAAPYHPPGPAIIAIIYDSVRNEITDQDGDSATNGHLLVEYRNVMEIFSLSPAQGLMSSGGQNLSIAGTNFATYDGRTLCRFAPVDATGEEFRPGILPLRFASGLVPTTRIGTFVSNSEVRCPVPPRQISKFMVVEVSCNGGHDFTSNALIIEYKDDVLISGITPESGPRDGGTLISLKGAQFSLLHSDVLQCAFELPRNGTATTEALVVSDSLIQCVSPPLSSFSSAYTQGNETFSKATLTLKSVINGLSLSGADHLSDDLIFSYYINPSLHTVTPASVPSRSLDPIMLKIHGSGFFRSPSTSLRLESAEFTDLPCVFLSHAMIECGPFFSNISPGKVPISLSFNGQDYTMDNQELEVTTQPKVRAILPNSGSNLGGTVVSVTGHGFDTVLVDNNAFGATNATPESTITSRVLPFCRFGLSIEVSATFINDTHIECITPASPIYEADSKNLVSGDVYSPTTVNVSVIIRFLNQKQKIVLDSPSTIEFEYHVPASLDTTPGTERSARVIPSSCGSLGGCVVDIFGSGFLKDTSAKGFFSARVAAAPSNTSESRRLILASVEILDVFSSTHARLLMPANPVGGHRDAQAIVQVSNNGVDFSQSGPAFWYAVDNTNVKEIQPAYIPESGNIMLRVKGAHFSRPTRVNGEYLCAFHGQDTARTEVDAKWISPVELRCMAPPGAIGKHFVEISKNSGTTWYSSFALQLNYFRSYTISSIYPAFGSEYGGDLLTLRGTMFPTRSEAALVCVFGSRDESPATVINSSALTCLSPELPPNMRIPSAIGVHVVPQGVLEAYGGSASQHLADVFF
jgi:hypothetical protein